MITSSLLHHYQRSEPQWQSHHQECKLTQTLMLFITSLLLHIELLRNGATEDRYLNYTESAKSFASKVTKRGID